MAHVSIDHAAGGCFAVRVIKGARHDKTTNFAFHADAVAFGTKQMGKTGMCIDYTTMTPEQRAKHGKKPAGIPMASTRDLDKLMGW